MRYNLIWIVLLIMPSALVISMPLSSPQESEHVQLPGSVVGRDTVGPPALSQGPGPPALSSEVISVRVTSSVGVDRQRGAHRLRPRLRKHPRRTTRTDSQESTTRLTNAAAAASQKIEMTEIPPGLAGANIEYIKQLNAKKEARSQGAAQVHPFQYSFKKQAEDLDDTVVEESMKSVSRVPPDPMVHDSLEDEVPLARSIPSRTPKNENIPKRVQIPYSGKIPSPRLTTISFNIEHDEKKVTSSYDEATPYNVPDIPVKPVNIPEPLLQETPTVYSQPSKVYSEPAKFYSEPAKVYGEPAKVYGEPSKVYGEPSKIYSEPAKFYSKPASLNLDPEPNPQWHPAPEASSTTTTTTTEGVSSTPDMIVEPEKNYEIEESVSVGTDGRSHGVQEENCKHDKCKVGYVVEGRQYRKYRVEERTADGFIVGEYGVVRNEDGALRGVRYTADGDTSPRLIYDALMKFLQL